MKLKFSALMALFLPIFAFAEDKLDTGDTAWMMVSTAFVLLMTPAGLALFYGGMTRSKNVLNTYAMVMGAFVVAFVVWIIAGYSIAFGASENAMLQNVFGGFGHVMLDGIKWTDLIWFLPNLCIYCIPRYICSHHSSDCIRFCYRTYEVFNLDGYRCSLGTLSICSNNTYGMGWRRCTSF